MKIEIELDNLTKEEQETVKRLAEKKQPYWVPEEGEEYYYIMGYADVGSTMNDKRCFDKGALSIGNCFKTEKQAREAITKLQMQAKWKRLSLEAGEADNLWDGEHEHYFAYWHCRSKELRYDYSDIWKQEKTYFPSEESLKAAIAKLGEENVVRYILGVME